MGTIEDKLKRLHGNRVYLDTNVFIYFLGLTPFFICSICNRLPLKHFEKALFFPFHRLTFIPNNCRVLFQLFHLLRDRMEPVLRILGLTKMFDVVVPLLGTIISLYVGDVHFLQICAFTSHLHERIGHSIAVLYDFQRHQVIAKGLKVPAVRAVEHLIRQVQERELIYKVH